MNILIGDIGNTDIKFCLINKDYKIIKKVIINKKKINNFYFLNKKIKSMFKGKKIFKSAIFSSVAPSYLSIIKKALFNNFKIKVVEVKEINLNKIIKIKANRKQVGSDRILNAIGSHYFYKSNCIVVDFGTATTFDVIINGVYRGGIIAPGINLSLDNLVKKAEQISSFSVQKIKKVIGVNTLQALRSGFFWGYIGLVDSIIKLVKKETKSNYKIILTGGLSHLFKNSLKNKAIVDKDITIKGLIKILKFKKYLN